MLGKKRGTVLSLDKRILFARQKGKGEARHLKRSGKNELEFQGVNIGQN